MEINDNKNYRFSLNRDIKIAEAIYKSRIQDANKFFKKYNKKFENRKCPFCGNDVSKKEKNFLKYKVCKCKKCNSLYVNPVPTEKILEIYYKKYKSNKILNNVLNNRAKQINNTLSNKKINQLIEIIKSIKKTEIRILELGCGNGEFMDILKKKLNKKFPNKKFIFTGVDYSIEKSIQESNKILIKKNVMDFIKECNEKYDFIYHYYIAEHLIDPFKFFVGIKEILSSKGIMMGGMPNSLGLEQLACGYDGYRLLAHTINPPMHINGFNIMNINILIYRIGFKIISIDTPGNLDVDICVQSKKYIEQNIYKELANYNENTRVYIQKLISNCLGSSDMMIVVSK